MLKPLEYDNQSFSCHKIGLDTLIMYVVAQILLLIMIFVDFSQSRRNKALSDKQIPGESNFFERLSNVDRKYWLAEEVLYRQRYGLQTMTENTF